MDRIRNYLSERDEEDEEHIMQIQSNNAQAAALLSQYQHMQIQTHQGRNLRLGRAPNVEKHRQTRGANMIEDYFVKRLVYNNAIFRQHYRMQQPVFKRIMSNLCHFDDFWKQKPYATGKLGLLLEQKMTCALCMLAYGVGADQCDEITRMGASTALKCLKKLCAQIEYLYGGRKGYPTVILEVVASYDIHVWHAFFGTPRAQNDLKVLGASNVFARVIDRTALEVAYKVNDSTYTVPYYLADGIYPRWQTFVKAISKPKNANEAHFTKMRKSYRKDVERYFGILQARWAILRHGTNLFKLEDLRTIMISCIILHNMIVEDEFVEEEFVELIASIASKRL